MKTGIKMLSTLIAERARVTPHLPAYQLTRANFGADKVISWRRHLRILRAVARELSAQGVAEGKSVALQFDSGYAFELFQQACLCLGASVAPLPPEFPAAQRERWLKLLKPTFLISPDAQLTSSAPLKRLIFTKAWLIRCVQNPGKAPQQFRFPLLDPALPALITFSSGSTGEPRALCFSSDQLLTAMRYIREAYRELTLGRNNLSWLPIHHLFQRIINLTSIPWGLSTAFASSPEQIFGEICRYSPALIIGVPRFYEKMLAILSNQRHPDRQELLEVLQKTEVMITGSAALAPRIQRGFRAKQIPLYQAYGVSECITPLALNTRKHHRLGTAGKLVEPDSVNILSNQELAVRSSGLALFSLCAGQPRAALELDDGWYKTGDLATIDRNGFVRLLGRISEVVKTSTGRKVHLGEVESRLAGAPGIHQLVVLAQNREVLLGVATIETPPSSESERRSFAKRFLRFSAERQRALPRHERVAGWVILRRPLLAEWGEMTATGKPRRNQIEQILSAPLAQLLEQIRSEKGKTIHQEVLWL